MGGVGSVDSKIHRYACRYSRGEEKGRERKKRAKGKKRKTKKWTTLFGSDREWRRAKGRIASIIGSPGIAHHGPPFSAILDVV